MMILLVEIRGMLGLYDNYRNLSERIEELELDLKNIV